MDHTGDGLEDWFELGSDGTGSVIQSEDKEPSEIDHMFGDIEFEDEIIPGDFIPLNKIVDDELPKKLCPNRENNDNSEKGVNADDVDHSVFNHAIRWKQHKPILGMRCENLGQLMSMLYNYVISNGSIMF